MSMEAGKIKNLFKGTNKKKIMTSMMSAKNIFPMMANVPPKIEMSLIGTGEIAHTLTKVPLKNHVAMVLLMKEQGGMLREGEYARNPKKLKIGDMIDQGLENGEEDAKDRIQGQGIDQKVKVGALEVKVGAVHELQKEEKDSELDQDQIVTKDMKNGGVVDEEIEVDSDLTIEERSGIEMVIAMKKENEKPIKTVADVEKMKAKNI